MHSKLTSNSCLNLQCWDYRHALPCWAIIIFLLWVLCVCVCVCVCVCGGTGNWTQDLTFVLPLEPHPQAYFEFCFRFVFHIGSWPFALGRRGGGAQTASLLPLPPE
jgi:hypothetical protein